METAKWSLRCFQSAVLLVFEQHQNDAKTWLLVPLAFTLRGFARSSTVGIRYGYHNNMYCGVLQSTSNEGLVC